MEQEPGTLDKIDLRRGGEMAERLGFLPAASRCASRRLPNEGRAGVALALWGGGMNSTT